MSTETLLERRYRVMGAGSPLFYDEPLHIVRGDGVWLFDHEGRRYLDAYNNVPHVGHCHPHVTAAIARHAATLNTSTRYLHEATVAYAERLTAMFDPQLSAMAFTCTGSEANELALRMASFCTGGTGVICTTFAYHGNTRAVAQISTAFAPFEGYGEHVRAITPPDTYRPLQGLQGPALEQAYVQEVAAAIDSLRSSGVRLAALLVDTLFSSEGLPEVPPEFMRRAVELVHGAGGLYIADEVQAGFGRMGSRLWGYQLHGVAPDIVTLGKPMGNGHPVAGVVLRSDLMQEFARGVMYFNTYGGNPVSVAAADAMLDVLEEEGLVENARRVGLYLAGRLAELAERHPLIGQVRGRGLFLGVDLVRDRDTREPATAEAHTVINRMRHRGVLISRVGPGHNVLKIRPPMPFSKENADLLVTTLDEVLTEI